MATIRVELSATVNVGNFNSVKASVAIEEGYTITGQPETLAENRDAKFEELLAVCNDKLDDAVLSGIRKVKAFTSKD